MRKEEGRTKFWDLGTFIGNYFMENYLRFGFYSVGVFYFIMFIFII